jgi:hypothetical protein
MTTANSAITSDPVSPSLQHDAVHSDIFAERVIDFSPVRLARLIVEKAEAHELSPPL